jgi:hypothetical protein
MIKERNLSIGKITLNGDTFTGVAQTKVSPRLTKRFKFEISPDSKTFGAINTEEIEAFSEIVEFRGKGSRAGKTLNCKVAQCGGRCLKAGEECRLTRTDAEKQAHSAALKKTKSPNASKSEQKVEEKKPDKAIDAPPPVVTGGLVRVSNQLTKSGDSKNNNQPSARKSAKQEDIDNKYASASPTGKDIEAWKKDTLISHASPESLAQKDMIDKYLLDGGKRSWDGLPDYVKKTAVDKDSLIDSTVRFQRERDESFIPRWESYTKYSPAEREKIEKKIANPRTKEADKKRLSQDLKDDRVAAEASAKRHLEREKKSDEQLKKELKKEFDEAAEAKQAESKRIRDKIEAGDKATIQDQANQTFKLFNFEGTKGQPSTVKAQNEAIKKHLKNAANQDTPRKLLKISSNASVADIKKAYRSAAAKAHPDAGGSAEEFRKVNEAFTQLRQEMDFADFWELMEFQESITFNEFNSGIWEDA